MSVARWIAGAWAALSALPAMACHFDVAANIQPSPPYILNASDQVKPGLAFDIVRTAASNIGCEVRFVSMPGQRVLTEVMGGHYSGALMYSYSDSRAGGLVFPMALGRPDPAQRMARLSYFLYRGPRSKLEWDGTRLRNADGAIGINLGYAVGDTLRSLGATVEEAPSTQQNLEKLRLGRIDAYAMYEAAMDGWVRRPEYAGFKKLIPALSVRDYYLAFSHSYYVAHRQECDKLWTAIGAVRDKVMAERGPAYLN